MDNLIGKGAIGEVTGIEDILQVDFLTDLLGDQIFIHGQNFGNTAADSTETENCYVQHMNFLPFFL